MEKQNRREFLKIAIAGSAGAAVTATQVAKAAPKNILRMTGWESLSIQLYALAAETVNMPVGKHMIFLLLT